MFETILSYGAVPIAGFLFVRCVAWHVPKLALMIWRGMGETSWRAMNAACIECGAGNSTYCDCHVAKLPFVPDYTVVERLEDNLFMACPSAFWLEPTRWTRPTWPAVPVEADLKWDRSPSDLALANATLPDELKRKVQIAYLGVPISSARRFDRRYS